MFEVEFMTEQSHIRYGFMSSAKAADFDDDKAGRRGCPLPSLAARPSLSQIIFALADH